MSLSPWIIYLWGIADGLSATLFAASIFSAVSYLVYCVAKWLDNQEDTIKRPSTCHIWITAILALFSVLTPSSKTIAVMVVAPAIVNSAPIQKDLPDLYKAAKDALMSTLTK